MFTKFAKKLSQTSNQEPSVQRDLALNITDMVYTRQVADFLNSNGIPTEIIRPKCRFSPNLKLHMNGVIVLARTVKSSHLLDVKDVRPYFSLLDMYKASEAGQDSLPISPVTYIITNMGYTHEAQYEAQSRGISLKLQPIVSPHEI